ncbi:hypothetical protein SY83_00835 [Paenibacillus swuensis]|uniref:DUF4097 domain-containing protein n=1 Tax=Paenibacillus swuensis TaxID=1178515 RepID=A0A172TEA1_9BACL|nr:DUF4097 family beta strand repeat-containing protein [Paenibacillus swuensis]ANE45123.1 hypothetical protein SY83_00835 [Paenibacillus swuensis]
MVRIGRITSAIILVTVGFILLGDMLRGTNGLMWIKDLWPVALILLGLEYVIVSLVYYQKEKKFRLNWGALLIAGLLSVAVAAYSETSAYSLQGIRQYLSNIVMSTSNEVGHRFDKELMRIELKEDIHNLELDNPNGSVTIRKGPVEAIEIQTVVWVNRIDEEKAKEIAQASVVYYSSDGDSLLMKTDSKNYGQGIGRRPRMNLVVVVPERRKLNLQIRLVNGTFSGENLSVQKELRVTSVNGNVTVSRVEGDVALRTTNGAISLSEVNGSANLSTTNGKVEFNQITGAVQANTSNGRIQAYSTTVGGDWELKTTNGSIEAGLPEEGSFHVQGSVSHGSISSELPLKIDKHTVEGTIGAGGHTLRMKTTNASIDIIKR